VRWGRLALLVLAGLVAAAAATVLTVAANVATGGSAPWFPAVGRHPLWWTAGATAGVAMSSLLVWGTQRWYDRTLKVLVPVVQRPEPWIVDRPAEVNQIVTALRRGSSVGITTSLNGAGGFGKTTVAKMVRADRRVLRRFGGRVYWVTLGRDADRQALAGLVNGLIAQIDPHRAVTFTDARQAGEYLAAVLAAGPRRMVVIDDVWSDEQLEAFPVAGKCARLVTTRNPSLAAGSIAPVKVDRMSEEQARVLISAGLPPLPPAVTVGLINETGRWPLLLRLVNKILADQARLQPDLTVAATDLLIRLRGSGKLQLDALTGAAVQQLDIGNPDERNKAVQATIRASTSLLNPDDYDRLAELSVFVEDEIISVTLVADLLQATGGLDHLATNALCARLADLALITLVPGGDGGAVTMHDVLRDFLREEIGQTRLPQLHRILVDTAIQGLPSAFAAVAGADGIVTPWWELPNRARYLWDHLIEHLMEAGRPGDAEEIACDLRWVGARLQRSGPAAPAADLSVVGSPRTARLQAVLASAAHLLAPTDPVEAVVDILHSRVAKNADWGTQVNALRDAYHRPRLVNRWSPPDLPDDALRRVLTGHAYWISTLAIAPDSSWLATGGEDMTVRIWDAVTGDARATLTGYPGNVFAVVIAPNGSWLAVGGGDQTVRIWETTTWQEQATLNGHSSWVNAAIVAKDGSWLISGSADGTARIWDTVTWEVQAKLADFAGKLLAAAPDGSWLAGGSADATVRIWDVATGQVRVTLTGHTEQVYAGAVAPDGSWLATGSDDRTVRIWDTTTWKVRATLTGHTDWVRAVAPTPDGSWLATTGADKTVRIWDALTWEPRATLIGHTDNVMTAAVAPDGKWLASGGLDRTVRIWDAVTRPRPEPTIDHIEDVRAVAAAPDGSWLASGSADATVRIWDVATGQVRVTLTGHTEPVNAVAVAPDGSWLASGGMDRTVRIWDTLTWKVQSSLTGHVGWIKAIAVAPDGSWLAVACDNPRIWEAAGQLRVTLPGPGNGSLRAVAIAPDGSWLATGDDRKVQIWDGATGQPRATFIGHRGALNALAVAPDGSWLATGGDDRTVRIWDTATGQVKTVLTGHYGCVRALAVTPDGSWLATGGDDGTIRIWDTVTGDAKALMRVENGILACTWLGADSIAISGPAGLYMFDFIAGNASPLIAKAQAPG
jgi:WD40 repeat protein